MQKLKDFRVTDSDFALKDMPTSADIPSSDKETIIFKTAELEKEITLLQEALYADGREGVVIVLQALDAAGKDSLIKHVMGVFDPQGVNVYPFKQPSAPELAHGFLWRAEQVTPERGRISIFNRSYYEDVLVVRVHHLQMNYKMPPRCLDMSEDEFFDLRYKDIRNYEEYLHHSGYRLLKIFLNVSKKAQGKRFLERIDTPDKLWKFSSSDMVERGFWDDYQKASEKAIAATASKDAPWLVLPADHKWQTRYYTALAVKELLSECCTDYPKIPPEERAAIIAARQQLVAEGVPDSKKHKN